MKTGDLFYVVALDVHGPDRGPERLVLHTHRVERVTPQYVWLRHIETDHTPRKHPTMDPRRDREQIERLYSTTERTAWLRAEHIYRLEVTNCERKLETARARIEQIVEYLAREPPSGRRRT